MKYCNISKKRTLMIIVITNLVGLLFMFIYIADFGHSFLEVCFGQVNRININIKFHYKKLIFDFEFPYSTLNNKLVSLYLVQWQAM